MKDSKVYTLRIKRLLRGLKKAVPVQELVYYEDPLEGLIHGLLHEHFPDHQAQQFYRKMERHFVDLNDIRVARPEEIMDCWGEHSPQAKDAAKRISSLLMAIFNRFHALDLNAVKKAGKRPARQMMQGLDGVSRFALDYCMLTSMQAHAMPLNDQMLEYLKAEGLVHPDADLDQAAGFLTKLIPSGQIYAAYKFIRIQWSYHTAHGRTARRSRKAKH